MLPVKEAPGKQVWSDEEEQDDEDEEEADALGESQPVRCPRLLLLNGPINLRAALCFVTRSRPPATPCLRRPGPESRPNRYVWSAPPSFVRVSKLLCACRDALCTCRPLIRS